MLETYTYSSPHKTNSPTTLTTVFMAEVEGERESSAQHDPRQHFVLIHGAGGGAWNWYKVKTLLEYTCGHSVTCLDLTGAGTHPTRPEDVLNFDHYNAPLIDLLSSLPAGHQVILVGHSAGGLSLSDAINRFGTKKIKLAVFVAATMLRLGFVTDKDIQIGVPDAYKSENCEETVSVVEKFQRQSQHSSLEDCVLSSMLQRSSPTRALTTARFEEGEDVDRVARIFIKTTMDQVLKPEQQEAMIKEWEPSDVYVLETDHMPIFSAPALLSGLLHKAALSSHGR